MNVFAPKSDVAGHPTSGAQDRWAHRVVRRARRGMRRRHPGRQLPGTCRLCAADHRSARVRRRRRRAAAYRIVARVHARSPSTSRPWSSVDSTLRVRHSSRRLIDNHQAVADEMGALTEAEGGVAWECIEPVARRSLDRAGARGDQGERRPDPRRPQLGRRAREPRGVDPPGDLSVELSAPEAEDGHPSRPRHSRRGSRRRSSCSLGAPTATSAPRSSATVSRPTRTVFPTHTRSPAGSVPSARPN